MKEFLQYHQSETVEPGLFQLFRVYLVFIDVLAGLNLVIAIAELQGRVHPAYYAGLVLLALLNFFLWNKKMQQKHGPLLLKICIALYVGMSSCFFWGELTTLQSQDLFEWLQFYFRSGFTALFIPFLIAAWQFGLRGTVCFLGWATLLETGIFLITLDNRMMAYSIGFILFRSINYFVIGIIISRLMLAQRKQRYELKLANQQLTHYATTLEQLAVSRERNRLARELHDTLAHTLSGVSVQLEAVRALWNAKPDQAHEMLEQALNDTRSGLTETRRALQNLRAEPLEDLALILALERLCSAFYERSGIQLALELPEEIHLSAAAQHTIYRIIQESLSNIDRHAAASQAEISLVPAAENSLILTIHDNGVGFDPANHPEENHFGLRGIQERAALIGADCSIESALNEGTTLRIQLQEEEAA